MIKRNHAWQRLRFVFYNIRQKPKILTDWTRRDETLNFDLPHDGWDSRMQCYPNAFVMDQKLFLLYNGNTPSLRHCMPSLETACPILYIRSGCVPSGYHFHSFPYIYHI